MDMDNGYEDNLREWGAGCWVEVDWWREGIGVTLIEKSIKIIL